MPKPPEVDAFRYRTQFWIECPFCRSIHFHGSPSGHRLAHCPTGPGGQKAPTEGYTLRDAGPKRPPPPGQRPRPWQEPPLR